MQFKKKHTMDTSEVDSILENGKQNLWSNEWISKVWIYTGIWRKEILEHILVIELLKNFIFIVVEWNKT